MDRASAGGYSTGGKINSKELGFKEEKSMINEPKEYSKTPIRERLATEDKILSKIESKIYQK